MRSTRLIYASAIFFYLLVLLWAFTLHVQPQVPRYVKVAPYYTPGAGTQNVTTEAGTDTSVDILQMGSMGRTLMPRSDKVYKIAVYLPADVATYATGIWFATNTVTKNSGGAPAVLTMGPKTSTFAGPFWSGPKK